MNVVFTTTLALQLGGIKYNHNKINCGPKFLYNRKKFLDLGSYQLTSAQPHDDGLDTGDGGRVDSVLIKLVGSDDHSIVGQELDNESQ